MSKRPKYKETYEVDAKIGAFYTGGNIEWHEKWLYCQNTNHVSKVCHESGIVRQEVGRAEGDVEPDVLLTFTASEDKLITAHKSGLLKLWNAEGALEKQWKSIHKGPIATLRLIKDVLLTGGSDGVVRIWDICQQVCVRALKGCTGVINVLAANYGSMFASGDDGNIISWQDESLATVYTAHLSKVTALAFSSDGCHMISAGRDKVLILWTLGNDKPKKILPVYQTVETLIALMLKEKHPNGVVQNEQTVLVGGDNGAVSIWDLASSKEVYKQQNSLISRADVEGSLAITHLLKSGANIAVVSADHNIIIHHLKSFATLKQFIGFSDEILDICLCGEADARLAVATNSKDIKLYDNATMNCQLLQGHTDLVLALNRAPFSANLLASSAKDNTIRIWCIDNVPRCVALGMRHTASVNSICFFNSAKCLVSGSQDRCLKLWNVAAISARHSKNILDLHADLTEVAHSKDINSIAVSPNDTLIASCSQDKSIKLWTEKLNLLGVLKGHKRGVWCCRFSPVDQVLLSASTDSTIKLWSISGLNCLKTITGHEASVLRAEFLSQGMQILSCGADGFVKLFDLKTSECKLTLDGHDGRVWSLAVAADESMFISGGSDSTLIKWRDVTEKKKLEKQLEDEQAALEEQRLANYLKQDKLLKALRLALKLARPLTVLRVIRGVIRKRESLDATIIDLKEFEKDALLKCATDWNTNSLSCHAAQLVFHILLREMQEGRYLPANARTVIEENLGYTERHYHRLTNLMQDLKFIDFTINCMQPFNKSECMS